VVRGDEFYMRAFWELSSTRSFGMAVGPIPWHRIVQYGDRAGLDGEMMRIFEYVMRGLDEDYLTSMRDRQKRQTEQTRPRVKPSRRR
jgi:hypothetical protein